MKKHLPLITVVFSTVIILMASDIFLPSMPQVSEYFGVDRRLTQFAISFYIGGQILATLMWGALSDNIGRKNTLLIGVYLFFIGTLTCIGSNSIEIFLLGRVVQGMGGIVTPVVGWALIQDVYPKDKSAGIMSWIGSVIALAPMSAPAIGGLITKHYHWKGDFYFIASSTIIVLIGLHALAKTPPCKKVKGLGQTFNQYIKIFKNKLFVSYVSLFALLASGQWCFLTAAPFLYKNLLNLPIDEIGFYMALSACFFIMGSALAARLMNRLGVDVLLGAGTKLSLVSGLILLNFHLFKIYNPLLLSLTFGFYLFCSSLLWGATSSRALQCFEEQRGAASSVRSLLISCFFAAGSCTGALINNDSFLDISLVLIILSTSAIALYFATALENRKISLMS